MALIAAGELYLGLTRDLFRCVHEGFTTLVMGDVPYGAAMFIKNCKLVQEESQVSPWDATTMNMNDYSSFEMFIANLKGRKGFSFEGISHCVGIA